MVTIITQPTWSVYTEYQTSLGGDHDGHACIVWLMSCLPQERQTRMSSEGDYLLPRCEVDIRTAMSGSYTYRGHTWNPVDSGGVEGTILNLPLEGSMKHRYTDFINLWGNPTEYLLVLITPGIPTLMRRTFDSAWEYSSAGWYVQTHVVFCTFVFDEIQYAVNLTFYTGRWNNEGEQWVIPNFANPIYHYKYLDIAPGVYCYHAAPRPQDAWIYKARGWLGNRRLRIYPHSTAESVISDIAFYCRQDAFERRKSADFSMGRATWFYRYTGGSLSSSPRYPAPAQVFTDHEWGKVNWRELAARAYGGASLSDINGIAGIKDVLDFGNAATSFVKSFSKLGGLSTLAAQYLSVHFGFKLFFMDLEELRHTLREQSERRSSLSRLNAVQTYTQSDGAFCSARYQVFYDQFEQVISLLDQALQISDVQLTLENWWDMVPYSFVVDWFINIGDILHRIDDYANMTQNHRVICAGQSLKRWKYLDSRSIGLPTGWICNALQVKRYLRSYSDRLILPSLVPSVTINPTLNHMVEGAALIISRK